jgi:flagellar biogenesis protein FliO
LAVNVARTIRIAMIMVVFALCVAASAAHAENGAQQPVSGKAEVHRTEVKTRPLTFPDKTAVDENVVPNDVDTLEKSAKKYDLPEGTAFSISAIWKTIGSLAIVIMLIVGLIYLMRQVWARGMRFDMKGRHIRVLDIVSLGVNRSLFLVAVGKKLVLLGSSDKGMNFLMEVTGLESAGDLPGELPGESGVSFQGELENAAMKDVLGSQTAADRTVSFVDRLKNKLKRFDEDKNND